MRGEVFASCEVLEEHADAENAILRVRGERATVERLREKWGRF
jgi:GTP-binding protein HflX